MNNKRSKYTWLNINYDKKENFVNKVKKKFGDLVDLSKSKYNGLYEPLTYICKEHGEVTIPKAILLFSKSRPCKKCAFAVKRMTIEEFMDSAKQRMPEWYEFVEAKEGLVSKGKFKIHCKKHNTIFEQTSKSCLLGSLGCKECHSENLTYMRTKPHDKFIKEATKVHKGKYDYSLVDYKNSYTKVKIICPIHGVFEQKAGGHVTGDGCYKCSKDSCRKPLDTFIEDARKIHGDKYDYSKTVYEQANKKVTVTCPKHGDFLIFPTYHLSKSTPGGCKECWYDEKTEDFIRKAKAVHGDKYDYSKSRYIRYLDKLTIICPTHGEFQQAPNNHLAGSGCQKCKSSIGEKGISLILDRLKIPYIQEYKIPGAGLYRYDFYVPDCNLLIEFHGVQHYYLPKRLAKSWCDEKKVIYTKKHDRIKVKLAKEYDYNLAVIPFTKQVRLVESLLNILSKDCRYKYRGKYYQDIRDIAKIAPVGFNLSKCFINYKELYKKIDSTNYEDKLPIAAQMVSSKKSFLTRFDKNYKGRLAMWSA